MALFDNLNFNNMIDRFAEIGGYDVILPFLLVFAVTFAILQKIGLFGDEKKGRNVNLIVSLIFAFFLVSSTTAVEIIQGFLPRVSLIVIVLLMLLLVIGIFTKSSTWSSPALGIGVFVAIIAILWAIGASAGWNVPWIEEITDQDIGVLLTLGVFILVIWLIVKEPKEGGSNIGTSLENLINSFKGSG